MVGALDSPFNRSLIELEARSARPPAQVVPVFERLLGRAQHARAARLAAARGDACAGAALALGDKALALRQIERIETLFAATPPFDLERAEVWRIVAALKGAAGERGAATDALGRGAAWLNETAVRLDASCRDEFLRVNPANRQLLAALATS